MIQKAARILEWWVGKIWNHGWVFKFSHEKSALFFFFYIDVKSRIANFDDTALFKFYGLIIKSVIGLCVLYFNGLVFSLFSWSHGVPQRCLRISGLWEEGQREGGERTSWYSAGASNSPPLPVYPEQLQFLFFMYWNSK